MDYRSELFKALTAGVDGVFRDKSIDALVEVCRAARKEGYDAGFRDGTEMKAEAQQSLYESGANDTWECVRKLSSEISGETIKSIFDAPYCEVFKRFTACEAIAKVKAYEEKRTDTKRIKGLEALLTHTNEEIAKSFIEDVSAVEELLPRQTEEICNSCNMPCPHSDDDLTKCFYDKPKQTDYEIKVGDEVKHDGELKGVVTQVDKYGYQIMDSRGECGFWITDDIKKTGHHFPQIAEVLMQMQEEE